MTEQKHAEVVTRAQNIVSLFDPGYFRHLPWNAGWRDALDAIHAISQMQGRHLEKSMDKDENRDFRRSAAQSCEFCASAIKAEFRGKPAERDWEIAMVAARTAAILGQVE